MQLVSQGKRSASVLLQSSKGSHPKTWCRVIKPWLGASQRTAQRVSKVATLYIDKLDVGRPTCVSNEFQAKVGQHLNLDTHVRGRPLLIPSAEDQMLLQQAGGMSDHQMLAVNQLMIKLTDFSIHSKKNTLSALVSGDTCDYTISKEKLLVNGTLQERHVFHVNRISAVIKDRVYSSYKNSVFIPSSSITALNYRFK
jgi:hypothetical protein